MPWTTMGIRSWLVLSATPSWIRTSSLAIAANTTQKCSLYLAPSSIKGAGLGVFAGRDFHVGGRIGEPGPGIQVTDPFLIYDAEELIAEFGWNSGACGGDGESDAVFTALPGVAMLANFHATLSNVIPGGLKEEPILGRSKPGAGSSTAYHNFTFLAKTEISAGEEIFASVGEGWFTYHEETSGLNHSQEEDHDAADEIISSLATFREEHPRITDAQFLDVLLRLRNEIIQKDEKLSSLIPLSIQGFDDALEKGTARVLLDERGIGWLEENGKCLDNIRSGVSTIPVAGRGAFASRSIEEGSVISPVPLVQVMNKSNFDVQPIEDMKISDSQLLLNYCFGHRKSALLLCPTTSVVLVNHNKKCNARIQWSELPGKSKSSSPAFMAPLDDLKPKSEKKLIDFNVKLSFDLIALRDIEENEEIFIDYGDEWEDAWDQHSKNWVEDDASDDHAYVPAAKMNAEERPILLSNDTKLQHHSYLCRLEPFAREDSIDDMPVEDYRANPTMESHSWNNYTRIMYEDNDYMWWWPCQVLDADPESATFRTEVYQKSPPDGTERAVIRRLKNIPRHAIKFIDKPYKSNQHLPSAFRHYIPIPDDMFPLHWRDDYHTAQSLRLGVKNTGAAMSKKERVKRMNNFEKELQAAKCGVYVAPSNIPNAGMGTYTGVSIPGQGFMLGSKMPVIPVYEMSSKGHWDADDYTWNAGNFYAEYEAGSTSILAVNEGCMANFHPGLVNFRTSDVSYQPLLDRRTDPGAGAFSDYINFSFESRHEVKAGDEAFISYGESWFQQRAHLVTVPLSANYLDANGVVASLVSLESTEEGASFNEDEATGVLKIVKEKAIRDERTKSVLSSIESAHDLNKIMSRNGTAEATTETKSLQWLEENGYCTDHIYSKQSTILQAGNGAFTRRFIAKGGVIIPSPLLCTWGRNMFDLEGDHIPDRTNKKQLVYNYQYAHPNSSVLFFPTNTAITINHKSSRGWLSKPPNAEIRWSQTDKKTLYLLQRPLDDLKNEHYASLVLDFVATRDIMPGEEVFVDYGEKWEEAWENHVRNFEPPCKGSEPCFKSSKFVVAMNDDKFNKSYYPWSDDHFTVCDSDGMPTTDDSVIFLVPRKEGDDNKTEVVATDDKGNEFLSSFRGIGHDHDGFDLAIKAGERYPCTIIRSAKDDGVFDVVYYTFETSTARDDANVLRRNKSLPADKLTFINKPYKADMHWGGAFRHEIKIPDNVFPSHWMDLEETQPQ